MSESEARKGPSAKKAVKADNFKRFAADTFGLRLNANLAQLIFSLDTQDEAFFAGYAKAYMPK